jgi:hypothetical protein
MWLENKILAHLSFCDSGIETNSQKESLTNLLLEECLNQRIDLSKAS